LGPFCSFPGDALWAYNIDFDFMQNLIRTDSKAIFLADIFLIYSMLAPIIFNVIGDYMAWNENFLRTALVLLGPGFISFVLYLKILPKDYFRKKLHFFLLLAALTLIISVSGFRNWESTYARECVNFFLAYCAFGFLLGILANLTVARARSNIFIWLFYISVFLVYAWSLILNEGLKVGRFTLPGDNSARTAILYFCFSLFFIVVVYFVQSVRFKIISILFFLLCLFVALQSRSRSALFVFLICVIGAFVYAFFSNKLRRYRIFLVSMTALFGFLLTLYLTQNIGLQFKQQIHGILSVLSLDRTTVYEDAEDGTTAGWKIYDRKPKGAKIENIFNHDRQSHVIKLNGKKRSNSYRLRKPDLRTWQNDYQHSIEWSMRFSEKFSISVYVTTTAGARFIYYTSEDHDRLNRKKHIYYGLGHKMADGVWHTIVRNLQADLERAQPGIKINNVNDFRVSGSGEVDDIKLHNFETNYYRTVGKIISRLPIWKAAVEKFTNYPVWGAGLSSDYYDEIKNLNYPHPHSVFLQFLAETGILGFGLYAVFITLIIKKAISDYRLIPNSADKLVYLFYPLSFTFFLLFSNFHFAIHENYYFWYFGGIIAGFDPISIRTEKLEMV